MAVRPPPGGTHSLPPRPPSPIPHRDGPGGPAAPAAEPPPVRTASVQRRTTHCFRCTVAGFSIRSGSPVRSIRQATVSGLRASTTTALRVPIHTALGREHRPSSPSSCRAADQAASIGARRSLSSPCRAFSSRRTYRMGCGGTHMVGTIPRVAILASRAASTRFSWRPKPRRFSSPELPRSTLPTWGRRISWDFEDISAHLNGNGDDASRPSWAMKAVHASGVFGDRKRLYCYPSGSSGRNSKTCA